MNAINPTNTLVLHEITKDNRTEANQDVTTMTSAHMYQLS